MRNACTQAITELAISDERVVVLSGDLGNQLFEKFKQVAPGRFYNCGIAEANLTGVAAGMAMMGLRPITYSIAPFITVRCLEQIRVDICYQNLPVIIVGIYAGFSYTRLGPTHQALDDIGLLRLFPNMIILCPCDVVEVKGAFIAALQQNRPVYIRIGKKNEPIIHQKHPEFIIGKSITVRKGRDICILSTGNIMSLALEVANELGRQSISVRVESFHTVKPLDETLLRDVFHQYALVVTIEEHALIGGLGGAVAEWLADHHERSSAELVRFGTHDQFMTHVGDQTYARYCSGLSQEEIVHKIKIKWGFN